MKTIEKAIKTLLDRQPFYAHFFLNSKIEYDTHKVETAAAAIMPTYSLLIFNTQFIEKLTMEEVCGVIEHEVMHLLFEHTTQFKKIKDNESMYSKDVANIAMDLSINQYIPVLPKGCVNMKTVEQLIGKPLSDRQDWEYYYRTLLQDLEKLGKLKPHDDHGPAIEGEAKDGRAVLRSSLDKAIKASKGNVPSHVVSAFEDLSQSSKLPWQQILSNFVARATSTVVKNTRKKTNRRFGIEQPGKVKKRELTLGVCVDSSGSISDESYILFMSEIDRISKLTGKTYVIDADCIVQNVQTVKKGKPMKKERYGSGGTAYSPAIMEALRLKCDAIVYFGDFDSSDTPADPGKPFLWVGVGSQEPPAKFGSVVRL